MDIVGIEKDLYSTLTNEGWWLNNFGLADAKKEIQQFLQYEEQKEKEATLIERKDLAVKIISKILSDHGKAPAFKDILDFLEKIEIGAG